MIKSADSSWKRGWDGFTLRPYGILHAPMKTFDTFPRPSLPKPPHCVITRGRIVACKVFSAACLYHSLSFYLPYLSYSLFIFHILPYYSPIIKYSILVYNPCYSKPHQCSIWYNSITGAQSSHRIGVPSNKNNNTSTQYTDIEANLPVLMSVFCVESPIHMSTARMSSRH